MLATLSLLTACAGLPQGVSRVPTQALPAAEGSELVRIAKTSTRDPALSGFRLLSWSEQSFATRIELANRARHSIDVQYYVLANDDTGHMLLRALRDAATRGVRVRVLLDDLYTGGSDTLLLGLAAHPNVEVRLFNPFPTRAGSLLGRFAAAPFEFGRLNHRMHNKLFIADGAMAVAGGRNIGNEYFMAHGGANYIDLDVFAVGAVLPRLGELFDRYWNSEHVYPVQAIVRSEDTAAVLQRSFEETTVPRPGRGPQPPPAGVRDLLGQLNLPEEMQAGALDLIWADAEAFADSPDKVISHRRLGPDAGAPEAPTVRQSLMKELLLARQDVLVSSPYMVPDRSVMEDIREGRLWGLPITIITNSLASTDEPLVHAGYRRYRTEMLDLGVQLYEVAPSRVQASKNLGSFGRSIGRFHAKAAAIDGKLMFIGSLNFDPRSEKHNTELGFLIRSPELTGQLLKLAEVVKSEAAYRVRLGKETGQTEWHITTPEGQQIFHQEPDTGWWQRALLWLVGPLVPEGQL
ncbi:MAG: phospholipase D family protein [Burkholderiaceae bacterium]